MGVKIKRTSFFAAIVGIITTGTKNVETCNMTTC